MEPAAANPHPPVARREVFGWCMFDFANSSYTTLVVSVAFSAYFVQTIAGEGRDGDFLWGLAVFISQLIVLLSAPVVGAIADVSGAKKRILLFTYLGCVGATACLGFAGPGAVVLGLGLFIVSNVLYSTGENVVAAFLPEIASAERMGRVSGWGWALGYVGGLACLFACRPFMAAGFGPESASSMPYLFLVVAAFFFLGGLPTFALLRERAEARSLAPGENYVTAGFRRVVCTLGEVRRHRQLFRFLMVFLLYNCGILIVVYFSSIYAIEEIRMTTDELVTFFIIVQVSASAGALAFGYVQDLIGSKTCIAITLMIWIVVCAGAYATRSAEAFFVIGNLAGIAMGSAMSAGRALVGSLSPRSRSGEFFGFWGLCWKLSAVGPLLFGWVSEYQGRREAILLTAGFFVLGLIGLLFVDTEQGRRDALRADNAEGGIGPAEEPVAP